MSTCDTYPLLGNGSLQYHGDGAGSDPSLNVDGWKYERGKKGGRGRFLPHGLILIWGALYAARSLAFAHD